MEGNDMSLLRTRSGISAPKISAGVVEKSEEKKKLSGQHTEKSMRADVWR